MAWDDDAQGPTEPDWGELLTNNPRVLWGIVADVVKAVRAGEGERKTGRRPAASVSSLDELYEVLFPAQFTEAPFSDALTYLLKDRTQQGFGARMGYSQPTVSRLLSGAKPPTLAIIERTANVLNVRPTYFREYRALKLGQLVTDALLANPALSADVVKRLAWTVNA